MKEEHMKVSIFLLVMLVYVGFFALNSYLEEVEINQELRERIEELEDKKPEQVYLYVFKENVSEESVLELYDLAHELNYSKLNFQLVQTEKNISEYWFYIQDLKWNYKLKK